MQEQLRHFCRGAIVRFFVTYLTIPLDDRTNQRLLEISHREHTKPEVLAADAVRRRLFIDWFEEMNETFSERGKEHGFQSEDDLLSAIS